MILMKNHLQPWAFSRCQGATSRTLRTPSKASREGPIYRLQWLVAGTLKVQGFLGKGSNRLMDEASTNRNFFVSVYDGHSTRFHTERCQNTVASNQRWDSQNNSTGIYWKFRWKFWWIYGYGSIPINTIFRGMNIHLPAILMFTRGTRFWPTAILKKNWTHQNSSNFMAIRSVRWSSPGWCHRFSGGPCGAPRNHVA